MEAFQFYGDNGANVVQFTKAGRTRRHQDVEALMRASHGQRLFR
jgi:hypothetical protein